MSDVNQDRKSAVREAWKNEKALVREGKGTRQWSQSEQREIVAKGRAGGYEGHHMKSVKDYPQYAGNPNNIQFLNHAEHINGAHEGNTKNATNGYYNPETKTMQSFGNSGLITPQSHALNAPLTQRQQSLTVKREQARKQAARQAKTETKQMTNKAMRAQGKQMVTAAKPGQPHEDSALHNIIKAGAKGFAESPSFAAQIAAGILARASKGGEPSSQEVGARVLQGGANAALETIKTLAEGLHWQFGESWAAKVNNMQIQQAIAPQKQQSLTVKREQARKQAARQAKTETKQMTNKAMRAQGKQMNSQMPVTAAKVQSASSQNAAQPSHNKVIETYRQKAAVKAQSASSQNAAQPSHNKVIETYRQKAAVKAQSASSQNAAQPSHNKVIEAYRQKAAARQSGQTSGQSTHQGATNYQSQTSGQSAGASKGSASSTSKGSGSSGGKSSGSSQGR